MTQSIWDVVLAIAALGLGWWLVSRQASWIARLAIGLVAIAVALFVGGILQIDVLTEPPT